MRSTSPKSSATRRVGSLAGAAPPPRDPRERGGAAGDRELLGATGQILSFPDPDGKRVGIATVPAHASRVVLSPQALCRIGMPVMFVADSRHMATATRTDSGPVTMQRMLRDWEWAPGRSPGARPPDPEDALGAQADDRPATAPTTDTVQPDKPTHTRTASRGTASPSPARRPTSAVRVEGGSRERDVVAAKSRCWTGRCTAGDVGGRRRAMRHGRPGPAGSEDTAVKSLRQRRHPVPPTRSPSPALRALRHPTVPDLRPTPGAALLPRAYHRLLWWPVLDGRSDQVPNRPTAPRTGPRLRTLAERGAVPSAWDRCVTGPRAGARRPASGRHRGDGPSGRPVVAEATVRLAGTQGQRHSAAVASHAVPPCGVLDTDAFRGPGGGGLGRSATDKEGWSMPPCSDS